ncbi:MAG: nickel-dependent lactate racemase [bacterium]
MDNLVRYGKSLIEIPDTAARRAQRLKPGSPETDYSRTDIISRFRRALDSPDSGPPFRDVVAGRQSARIVVSDKTRRYGADIWLSALLDELNACGVADDGITVLFALGMHEAQTAEERAGIVGAEAAGRVRLVDHDCDNAAELVSLGRTAAGTPVAVNKLAAEADLLIVTGVVMPHYYAGFTGGRKSIVPGLAARETVLANHSLNLAPGGGTHPLARTASLAGNPIHEDLLDALGRVRVDFAIQVIADGQSRPAAFFTGGIAASHEAACRRAARWFCVPIPARAPWVIASCGGYPKDINFYQSHKSLDNAFRAVAPGGTIILVTACSEGIGPDGFAKWFEEESTAEIESKLRMQYSVMGHTALRTLEKTGAARVFLLSEMPETFALKMGMTPLAGPGEIEKAVGALGGEGLILPQAALTVPTLIEN